MNPSDTELEKSDTDTVTRRSTSQPIISSNKTSKNFLITSSKYKTPSTFKSFISVSDIPPEQPIQVYHKGEEVTPQQQTTKKYTTTDTKYDLENDTGVQKTSRKSVQVTRFSSFARSPSAFVKRKISQASLTNLSEDKNLANFTDTEEYEEPEEKVPSAMCLPFEFTKVTFPEKMKLILEETENISLFELPSKTVTKGTEEAEVVEKQNEIYEYLTVGKGKNRKKVSTEAQTIELILKTRHTNGSRTERQNNYAFASVWDMFDSYQKGDTEGDLQQHVTDEMKALNKLYETKNESATEDKTENNESSKIKINTERFLNAACIMERVLANNNFKEEQENYKDLLRFETGPLLADSFNYMLKSLWTFHYYKIEKKPVCAIAVNSKNTDVIAVGYGKVKFTDEMSGIVCIWNIKNPTQPERFYEFEASVTSMSFSSSNPNLLAVGFYNGEVCILDITSYKKVELARSSKKSSPSYLPIWQINWFYDKQLNSNTEQVFVMNFDGRVDTFRQTKTKDFICHPILKLMHIDNLSRNMIEQKKCNDLDEIPLFKTENCQTHCWHPTLQDIYFVGTASGCIYKCSTNYYSTYLEMFPAHRGPINGMEFSKFCEDIFITCGSDWTVKIWKENIFIPLIVLTTDMNPVMSATFSPTHSTVITAVSGTQIYLWNIQHKVDSPSLQLDLAPKFGNLTMARFTANGKHIIVADVNGKLHMRYLLGLFPAPGNQGRVLEQAIHNNLVVQPKLMAHIEKTKKIQKYL